LGKSGATLYFADPAGGAVQVVPTAFNIPVADASTAKVGMSVTGTGVVAGQYISAIVGNDLFVKEVGGTFATGAALTLTPTSTIRLDGAKYVTIDGGSKANLTFDNANNNSNTIQMANDASNNTIANCTVNGLATACNYGAGNILIGNSLNGLTGCDNNTITNCDINGTMTAAIGVDIAGTVMTASNDNNTISNCNIFDFNTAVANSIYGIYTNSLSTTTKVNNNQIYWTSAMNPTVGNVYYGMYVGGESNTISGNKVGYSDAVTSTSITSTSTPRFVGILTVGGANGAETSVSGNNVANITLNTFSTGDNVGVGYGMLAGIAVDNSYTVSNIANRSYVNIVNNNVNNLALLTNAAPAGNTYWNTIGITSNAHYSTMSDNTVHTLSSIAATTASANKQAVRGINAVNGSVVNATISRNKVYNITAGDISATSSGNQITAISCASTLTEGTGSIMEKNLVYNIKALNSTNTAIAYGLQTYNGTALAIKPIVVRNNMVRLGTDVECNGSFFGYYPQDHGSTMTAANSKVNFYNNTIFIGGAAKDAAAAIGNSACIYRKVSKIGAFGNYVNNILENTRTGGTTGVNAAILLTSANDYGTTPFMKCDSNLYYISTDASAKLGAIIATSAGAPTSSFATLGDWKTTTSQDAASIAGPASFVDSLATVPNLHILKTSIAVGAATATDYVADDFDGDSRTTATKFVIGADVPDLSTAISAPVAGKSGVYAIGKNIFFSGVAGAASVLDAAGALVAQVSSAQVAAGSANLSDLKSGLYVVVVNGKATKVILK